MKILYVADGRSSIAINWIRNFDQDHEVHLVSIYPCDPELNIQSLTIVPLMFSKLSNTGSQKNTTVRSSNGMVGTFARWVATPRITGIVRQHVLPWTMESAARKLREKIAQIQPDLVHAMRIPYEGMLAARANSPVPLMVSIWGNDFTWHARSTKAMGRNTRLAMSRAIALHADAQRDVRLAREWGYPENRPAIVLPSGGGIRTDIFYPPAVESEHPTEERVVNPRGVRSYVKNSTFFQAIPLVLKRRPNVKFVCPSMKGETEPETWINRLGIGNAVRLLPSLPHPQLAQLFRESVIAVSPTVHDGTPNSVLECMACGCYPIAGDLESLREWIEPGKNGALINPEDPDELANEILKALENPEIRRQARQHNMALIKQRADSETVKLEASKFYQQIIREAASTAEGLSSTGPK